VTTERKLQQLINAEASSDGADYIGGFPSHPHRGFETITYMLDGAMRHRDHLGNEGVIRSGNVQWMTAGRGVIHSEMPEQTDGLLHGFQLWLNLPAAEKMCPAGYQDCRSSELPVVELARGGRIKVIAGSVAIGHNMVSSPIGPADRVTRPVILDVTLQPVEHWTYTVDSNQTLLVRVYEGATTEVSTHQMGVYVSGDALTLTASDQGARALVLAGAPLREPVWQHGPFVMNTRAEIETAIQDYNEGRLVD